MLRRYLYTLVIPIQSETKLQTKESRGKNLQRLEASFSLYRAADVSRTFLRPAWSPAQCLSFLCGFPASCQPEEPFSVNLTQ